MGAIDFSTRQKLKKAEEDGLISDTMETRMSIVKKIEEGELSLEEGQKLLKILVSQGKKEGKMTRSQFIRNN